MGKIPEFIHQIGRFVSKNIAFNILVLLIAGGSAYHFLIPKNPQKPTVDIADANANESQTLYIKFDPTQEEIVAHQNPTYMGVWNFSYKDNNEVILTGNTYVMCVQETSTKEYPNGCGAQAQFKTHLSVDSLYGFLIKSKDQIVSKFHIPSITGNQDGWIEIQLNSDGKCTPSCTGTSYFVVKKDDKGDKGDKIDVRNLEISSDKNGQVAKLIASAINFQKKPHPDNK